MSWPEKHTCHGETPSVFTIQTGNWRLPAEHMPWRTCDYCGSIHPEDLVSLVEKYPSAKFEVADMKYGHPHKIYIDIQEKLASGQKPWVKFYTVHFVDDGITDADFETVAALVWKHAGVLFSRDERGVKWCRP